MSDRLAAMVLDEGGQLQLGEFPMTFTDLHDLSTDYLVPQVMAHQQDDLAVIQAAADQLRDAPAARAIAEEALGAALGHLDCLAELPQAGFAVRKE